jgi:exodeoxyribonuclease V gamma subunit
MPRPYLHFLNALAKRMDVHFYLLSPVQEFWGDLRKGARTAVSAGEQDSGRPAEEAGHPLLVSLGGQGRDLQNLLVEEVELAGEFSSFSSPYDEVAGEERSLLKHLQADILAGKLGERKPPGVRLDSSLKVVSCHSPLRELQVVRDHLLEQLHRDPELELRHLVVMAPDIQDYAPYIPAVFHDIQHSIADRHHRQNNQYLAAFSSFLSLFKGRFSLTEIFDLLQLPCVYPQFALSDADIEMLFLWSGKAGIRWGVSAKQRREAGLADFAESSWMAGMERLMMGVFTGSEELVDGVYPCPGLEGQMAYALGGLRQFIELIEESRSKFARPQELRQWSISLGESSQALLGEPGAADHDALRDLLLSLEGIPEEYHGQEVDFAVLYEWFTAKLSEQRSSSGFLRGQLTFCSMLPMRSIPFRSICLLGLNEGVFPRVDNYTSLDLMAGDHRAGDRSARNDDRYQFLEALCAARSSLYLSYQGRSIANNEVLPPSVVVAEFLELLRHHYGITEPVLEHPLHPFSSRYFTADRDRRYFSYDQHHCRVSQSLYATVRQPPLPWWSGRLMEERVNVDLSDLQSFFANPQQFFVRQCLGVRPGVVLNGVPETELFSLDGLERYYAEQDVLAAIIDGAGVDSLITRLQAASLFPLGSSADALGEQLSQRATALHDRVSSLDLGKTLPDLDFTLESDGMELNGRLDNRYQNGFLVLRFGPLRGRDLLRAWLVHLVAREVVEEGTVFLVAEDQQLVFTGRGAPALGVLLAEYRRGTTAPSQLFTEPAFHYINQLRNPRARKAPLLVARETLRRRLENGYEPELELLLRGNPDLADLSQDFVQRTEEIFGGIMESANA